MSRPPEGPDPDLLFDLPLDPIADELPEVATPREKSKPGNETGEAGEAEDDQGALTFTPEDDPAAYRPSPVEAPPGPRFVAAVLDLVVQVAILGFALAALRLLEVPIDRRMLAPLAVFVGSFSFLYQVMPLTFWGHTPGMAYAGIHGRAKGGGFMTIQQCVLRWLGWLLTLATAGIAGLLSLSGVSLTDLLSGTRSYLRQT